MPLRRLALPLLLAALAWLSATAQGDPGTDVLALMYAKLAASFAASRGQAGGGDFLILANPGLVLAPDQVKDLYALSQLLDKIPLPYRMYVASGMTYSSTYKRLLDLAVVTTYQKMADKDKALAARKVIMDSKRPGKPTPEYADYLKYQQRYDAALDALEGAQVEQKASGAPVPPGLSAAVREAEAAWAGPGHRRLIEAAQADLKTFYESNAPAMFARLRDDFSSAQITRPTPWVPVVTSPPPEQWQDETGWQPWRFQQADLRQPAPAPGMPLAATKEGAPGPAIPWSATLVLAAQVKPVEVDRPWMDEEVFRAQTWRLQENSGFRLIASGNPADPDPGPMPLLITGLLLARKVSLTGTWASAAQPTQVGPFALPAAQASGGQVTVTEDDLQIIAFYCRVLPRCPNPDPKFFR